MTTKTRRAPRKTSSARYKKRIDTALAQLAHVELVKLSGDAEPAYLFKHALVQDTTQSTLLHGEYKRLNRLVGEAYERLYQDRCTDELAPVLAQHYAAAGESAKTVEYATCAGDAAARIFAFTEALGFYSQAIEVFVPGGDPALLTALYLKRGRMLELVGDYGAALVNYEQLAVLAEMRGERRMELAARMASTTIYSTPNAKHDPSHARVLAEQTLTLARELNDRPAQAKILWNLLLAAHFGGQREDAVRYGEEAIALARELNLRQQLAYSLNDIARSYMLTRRLDKSIAALQEANEIWRTLDNLPMLADNLNTLATMYYFSGEMERALGFAADGYRIGEQMNNFWAQAHSLMIRSLVLSEQGEIAESIAVMQEGISLAQRVGFVVAITSMQSNLALTYASLGDIAGAIALMQGPVAGERPADWAAQTSAVLGQLYGMNGEIERARLAVKKGMDAFSMAAPSPLLMGSIHVAELELALADRDYARALTLAARLIEAGQERELHFYQRYAMLLKARALIGLGRPIEAVPVLEQACDATERLGGRRYYWQILALLAEIENGTGHTERASRLYARAREIIQYIADRAPQELCESFLNMPDVRNVLAKVGAVA